MKEEQAVLSFLVKEPIGPDEEIEEFAKGFFAFKKFHPSVNLSFEKFIQCFSPQISAEWVYAANRQNGRLF